MKLNRMKSPGPDGMYPRVNKELIDHVSFNLEKCKRMDLGRTNPQQLYHMTNQLGKHTNLKQTVLEKDLGIWVDTELTFSHHCGSRVAKASRTLGMICRASSYLDGGSLMCLYTSLV